MDMPQFLKDFTTGMIDVAKTHITPDSLTDLTSTANSIFNTVIGGAKTGRDKFREMSHSHFFRNTFSWFSGKSDEFESQSSLSDQNDDDFDAGFPTSDDESPDGQTHAGVLDYDGMKGIMSGQISAMYQIGGKQAEASTMNTAEIITTLNNRTSEILASITKVNSSLEGISSKLDKLVELSSVSQEEDYKTHSIFDSNGRITAKTFVDFVQNSMFATQIKMGISTAKLGASAFSGQSPGEMLASAVGLVIGDNKFVADTKKRIDTVVRDVQDQILGGITKSDQFKKWFGDINKRVDSSDYSSHVKNEYTRDRATFDGITRKSIVTVIPGYLQKITEALTGITYNISNTGELTTDAPGGFRHVYQSSLIDEGISNKRFARNHQIGTLDSSKQKYINLAQKILISLYVGSCMDHGYNRYPLEQLQNGGDNAISAKAVELLAGHEGQSAAEWRIIIDYINSTMMIDHRAASEFQRAIYHALNKTDRDAKNYAKQAVYTLDIGKFTSDIRESEIKSFLDNAVQDDTKTSSTVSPTVANVSQAASLKSIDYIASIFTLLNRGINVYQSDTPFKLMDPIKVSNDFVDPNVNGNRTTSSMGAPGETQQNGAQGKIWDAVKSITPAGIRNKISTGFSNLRDDASSAITYGLDTIVVKNDIRQAKKMISADGIDPNDKIIADGVLAAMQAAVADGNTSEDIGALSAQIGQIKDEKLRSKLSDIVTSTLQRNESKEPAKSRIGKILSWGWGKVKTFVLPLFSKIKSAILSVGKKILPVAQKIFSPLINLFKSGIGNIKDGVIAIGQSLFGSEESQGIIGRTINFGIRGAGKLINKGIDVYNNVRDQIDENRGVIGKTVNTIGRGVNAVGRGISTGILAAGKVINAGIDKFNDVRDRVSEGRIGTAFSKVTSKIGEKFSGSEFAEGFKSVFNKEEKKPETVADAATSDIQSILESPEGTSKSGKATVFTTFFQKLTDIKDAIMEGINGKTSTETSGSNGTTATVNTDTTTSSGETGGDGDVTTAQIGEGVTSTGAETPTAESGGTGDAAKNLAEATSDAASDAGGKKKGLGFDIGKSLGGISKVLMGIGQVALSIVAGMSGVKAIVSLVTGILQKSLMPLNKLFQSIYKMLKPVVDTITKSLTSIVEYVVQIVDSVVKVIQPILEAINPIVDTILKVVEPILKLVTGLVNVLMVPITGIMKSVVVPVLQGIANTLEIILGVVQTGFGMALTVLGGILTGVGLLGKLFGASSLFNQGKSMMDTGIAMTKSGFGSIKSGFAKGVSQFASMATFGIIGGNEEETSTQQTSKRSVDPNYVPTGSPMEGTFGSGDIYGGSSLNQHRYGNYMNMDQRGCGPVALADAYMRRSGGRQVDPRALAVGMESTGAYNQSRGTSVRGYLNTARALGMNMNAGGVTAKSLSHASPSNPITLIGSGNDFTTKNGNNHYMNVVGSSNGVALVSNPMTGRVERKSVSSLVSNSLMGLYGSGDEAYPFTDDVREAFSNLKNLAGKLFSIFTMEDQDDVASKLSAEETKRQYDYATWQNADLTDEEKQKIDDDAFELFKKTNPMYQGESEKEYRARYESNKEKYWLAAQAAYTEQKMKESPGADSDDIRSVLSNALGESGLESFASMMEEADSSVDQGGFMSQLNSMNTAPTEVSGTGFYSDKGARLATDSYVPSIFTPNIVTKGYTGESPLHEFFTYMNSGGKTNQAKSSSDIGHWFYLRQNPDTEGKGYSGSSHSGIDFNWMNIRNPEIPATTDGVVKTALTSPDKSTGYTLKWTDIGGDEHHYYHLTEPPYTYVNGVKIPLREGDTISGGQIVGQVGSTGHSSGNHLHYTIRSGGKNTNPMTFFKWHQNEEELDPNSFEVGTGNASYSLGIPVVFKYITDGQYEVQNKSGELLCYALSKNWLDANVPINARTSYLSNLGALDGIQYTYSPDTVYIMYGFTNSSDAKIVLDALVKTDGEKYAETVKNYVSDNGTTTFTTTIGDDPSDRTTRLLRDIQSGNWHKSSDGISHETPSVISNEPLTTTSPYDDTSTWNLATTTTTGSGDAASSISIPDIPPLSNDRLNSMLEQTSYGRPTVVNRYMHSSRQSVLSDTTVQSILTNTYNVRSEKIESLLGEMLTLMKDRNRRRRESASRVSRPNPNNLFPETEIPSQVQRLSVG